MAKDRASQLLGGYQEAKRAVSGLKKAKAEKNNYKRAGIAANVLKNSKIVQNSKVGKKVANTAANVSNARSSYNAFKNEKDGDKKAMMAIEGGLKTAKYLKDNKVPQKIASGLKKGGKAIVKGAKVGLAGAKLYAKMKNPVNQAKMVAGGLTGKGWVLPGSKYIGPGNAMNLGKPNSAADAAAYDHDVDYDNYLKQGYSKKKVYGGFSDADQRLMDRADVTKADGLAAYMGMGVKKIGHKLGLSGSRLKDKGGYKHDWNAQPSGVPLQSTNNPN